MHALTLAAIISFTMQGAANGETPASTAGEWRSYRTDLESAAVEFHLGAADGRAPALLAAFADDATGEPDATGDLNADSPRLDGRDASGQTDPVTRSLAAPARFGARGTTRGYLHGGWGFQASNSSNNEWIAGLGVEHFIEEGLSLSLELNGLSIRQDGPNARAVNVNLLFRWHLVMEERWSFYLDGGAGLLFASEEVPDAGSEFNFTPQAGLGATFDIGGDVRLMAGARWHHISNANTDSNNPGRDNILAYAGVSIPF